MGPPRTRAPSLSGSRGGDPAAHCGVGKLEGNQGEALGNQEPEECGLCSLGAHPDAQSLLQGVFRVLSGGRGQTGQRQESSGSSGLCQEGWQKKHTPQHGAP